MGNLVHPVDTADGAALDGRHVAGAVTTWLAAGGAAGTAGALGGRVPPDSGDKAVQSGAEVGRVRVAWPAAPGRILRVP